jgi:hypothetical protein
MKKNIFFSVIIASMFIVTFNGSSIDHTAQQTKQNFLYGDVALMDDIDPLVDLSVTVEIRAIRYLEEDLSSSSEVSHVIFERLRTLINSFFVPVEMDDGNPDFNVKLFINDEEFTSDIWTDSKYVYETWTATADVPDEEEFVTIKIQLWDLKNNTVSACDISGASDSYDVDLVYNIKTGKWTGDDSLGDVSGYGRLCGTDDGTIYELDNDCELWFTIYQNDYDGDGIPYWTEVFYYYTDPLEKEESDSDDDGVPLWWEYKWGYDPFVYTDHSLLDPDRDSINNYEEYITSEWLSDPFRKDVFVELDMMQDGPNGEKVYFPEHSEELLNTAFNRQNIVFHLDYGDMGGHERVPFDDLSTRDELETAYYNYFLHGDEHNWRRGVFHYGIITYNVNSAPGWMFRSNSFQLASLGMEDLTRYSFLERDIIYASGYMHELGHTFAFYPIPGHNQFSQYPWQVGYWINRPYKSCMNYGWVYTLVDYSDGSHISPDIDDWERIDYDAFEREWN